MPEVVLVRVHLPRGCEQMKECQPVVLNRIDRPAVKTIGIDVFLSKLFALLVPLQQGTKLRIRIRSRSERRDSIGQGRASSSSGGSILFPEKFLCFSRPGHQFAIEAKPIGLQFLPQSGRCCSTTNSVNQLLF